MTPNLTPCWLCGRPTLGWHTVENLFGEHERRPICGTCEQEPPKAIASTARQLPVSRPSKKEQIDLFRG